MLKFSISKNGHNLSHQGRTISNNQRESKNVEPKNQNQNFLHDVILPKTLDIENMRIIKKHNHANSPQTIAKKVVQMKKSKIQKKIQSIVIKNTQNANNPMNNVQSVTKYTKQNVKSESKFALHDKYKKSLFEEQIPVEKMKLFCDDSKSCTPVKKVSQINNQFDDFVEQQKESPFIINMDEKIGEKRLMQEQVFQPLKQKIKKVIDKTINTGVNGKVNGLIQKINFYLTSIKEIPGKQKIKRFTVDVHKTDEKVKSYCEEIQKGGFLKTQNLKISKLTVADQQLRQYRSKSSLNKTRPLTAGISPRTTQPVKERTFLSSNRASSASTSRLNRFAKSTSQFNIKHRISKTQIQKKHMNKLLDEIESTCWQSHFDNKIISKKMQKMSNQWDIDGKGIRIYENKRISMTEETLEMLKRVRTRVPQVEEIEKQLIEKDQ